MFKYIIFLIFPVFVYATEIGKVLNIRFSPSDDCENLIIDNIKQAKSNINIVIYSFTDKDIMNAIKQAKDNNIDIQIIADKMQSKGKGSVINELIEYGTIKNK
jgi:phosphatidylserine/phosphatidylglycerophosphate/cardiolipin synthase-like enzyme